MRTTTRRTLATFALRAMLATTVISCEAGATDPALERVTSPTVEHVDEHIPETGEAPPGMTDGVVVFEDGSYITDAGNRGCLEGYPCDSEAGKER